MTSLSRPAGRRRFILANTAILSPPHLPEIRLRLADEAHELWQKTEEQLGAIGLPPPFWAFAWAGGQGLARHILDRPDSVRGANVLDLACGSGLVAIAAAKAGANSVTANDIDPFCETAVALNAALNSVKLNFDGRDLTGEAALAGRFDIVLAGDVFYDRDMAARLTPWLAALARTGTRILVGDPGRAYLPRRHLRELSLHQVPVTRALEDGEVKRTIVWEFSAAGDA